MIIFIPLTTLISSQNFNNFKFQYEKNPPNSHGTSELFTKYKGFVISTIELNIILAYYILITQSLINKL